MTLRVFIVVGRVVLFSWFEMLQLKEYGESEEDVEEDEVEEDVEEAARLHLDPPPPNGIAGSLEVCPAPDVLPLVRQ